MIKSECIWQWQLFNCFQCSNEKRCRFAAFFGIRCPLLFTIQFASVSVSVSISLSYWILDWLHSKKWANISKWWQDDSILNATHNESSSNVTANSNIEKWLFRWKGYNLPKHDIGIGVDWVSVTKKRELNAWSTPKVHWNQQNFARNGHFSGIVRERNVLNAKKCTWFEWIIFDCLHKRSRWNIHMD